MVKKASTQGNPGDTLLTPWEQPLHYFVLFSSWNPLDGLCPFVDVSYFSTWTEKYCFLYLNKSYLIGVLWCFLHKPICKSWVSSRNGFSTQSKLFPTFNKRKKVLQFCILDNSGLGFYSSYKLNHFGSRNGMLNEFAPLFFSSSFVWFVQISWPLPLVFHYTLLSNIS